MELDNFKLKYLCKQRNFDRNIVFLSEHDYTSFTDRKVYLFKFKFDEIDIYFKMVIDFRINKKISDKDFMSSLISNLYIAESKFKKLNELSFCREHERYLRELSALVFRDEYLVFRAIKPRGLDKAIHSRIRELIAKHKGDFIKAYDEYVCHTNLKEIMNL